MIKEFLESLKIKDIVFFVLIIVLFCMVLKKNKKEGFAGQISDANLQAINNLGQMVKTISDSSGKLTLNELVIQDGDKNVNVLDKLKFIEARVNDHKIDYDNRVSYVNRSFLQLDGGTMTGTLIVPKIKVPKIEDAEYIKVKKLVPKNGNTGLNYWVLENKSDGAYLLPRCNNCNGIGKPDRGLDDLYVSSYVSYD